MAQTLHSNPPGRISQLLPTVKCSNCAVLVPLTELGEHICATAPALPKPPSSPSSLLPARLQGFVSRRSQTFKSRESNVPERHGTPSIKAPPPARLTSPGPSSAPPFAQPNSAQLSPGWNLNRIPSPLSDGGGSSRNDVPLRERLRSTSDSRKEPPTPSQQRQRTLSTGRKEPHLPQPPPSPIVRNRTPSNDSRRPTTPIRPSLDSRPSQDLRSPNTSRRPSFDDRPPNDTRAPNTPLRPSFNTHPSNDARSPSRNPSVDTRSSHDTRASSRQPSLDTRPSDDARAPSRRPSFDTRPPDDARPSSARPSVDHFSSSDRQRPPRERRPSTASVRPPPRQGSYALDVLPPTSPPPASPAPPRSPALSEPDTKVGGDAGMAGVGRRGFAAAAHAAMFATVAGHVGGPRYDGGVASEGADGRRPNAPKYLDINTASSSYSAGTPPLSPNSGYSSHSPGPRSPISPHGGHLSTTRSSTSTTKGGVSPAIVRTPSPGSANRAAFFDKFKDKIPPVDTSKPYEPVDKKSAVELPPSPSTGSEYGLAYADSTDDEGGELVQRLPSPPPSAPPPARNRSLSETKANLVRFPSVDEKTMSALKKSASSSSGSSGSRFLFGSTRQSSLSGRNRSNSGSASNYSRSTARSTHALEKAMETLFEEGSSATGSSATNAKAKNGRSNTIPGLPPQSPEHKAPKLPIRSLTSPSSATFEDAKRKKKKECMKCDKTIDDGRWIQTDAGGVLCEKCWKNMYLPKCRRCTKPIEKQAVSSSDGQLKGKYHRECFNCHTCHKPFPDKEFYVLDGKPLCAYHYHEANESLCASCGQPIEGPCAVSHTGQRYHPEHLSCEYPGCKVTLDEYWEADGKMMCERHANIVVGYSSEDYEGRLAESKAQRRFTRFIDLANVDSDDLR